LLVATELNIAGNGINFTLVLIHKPFKCRQFGSQRIRYVIHKYSEIYLISFRKMNELILSILVELMMLSLREIQGQVLLNKMNFL